MVTYEVQLRAEVFGQDQPVYFKTSIFTISSVLKRVPLLPFCDPDGLRRHGSARERTCRDPHAMTALNKNWNISVAGRARACLFDVAL